jgi:hypothetical protein
MINRCPRQTVETCVVSVGGFALHRPAGCRRSAAVATSQIRIVLSLPALTKLRPSGDIVIQRGWWPSPAHTAKSLPLVSQIRTVLSVEALVRTARRPCGVGRRSVAGWRYRVLFIRYWGLTGLLHR